MKKLNRKGFTLIELLAVIVILAVVMGIAITSVLSSMNKARAGAIGDTALIIANAFNQAYTESLVSGAATQVFKDANGSTFTGYDFTSDKTYALDDRLADTFGISKNTYELCTHSTEEGGTSCTAQLSSTEAKNVSFVTYNSTTGKFIVCMAAKKTGPNYVTNFATDNQTTVINGIKLASGAMVACSDTSNTWDNVPSQQSQPTEQTNEG